MLFQIQTDHSLHVYACFSYQKRIEKRILSYHCHIFINYNNDEHRWKVNSFLNNLPKLKLTYSMKLVTLYFFLLKVKSQAHLNFLNGI